MNVKKSYIPCRDRARAALELCSRLQSAWPGKEQSLFCRDGNDRMEESECASESAQARESEAHFSARLLLPSLYFLRGRKKNGHGKKKKAAKIKGKVQIDVASPKTKPIAANKLKRKTRRRKVE